MTLKEKFENINILVYSDFGDYNRNMEDNEIQDCIDVADKFAIGFAEWVENNCDGFERYEQRELLEMYKKEKGL